MKIKIIKKYATKVCNPMKISKEKLLHGTDGEHIFFSPLMHIYQNNIFLKKHYASKMI